MKREDKTKQRKPESKPEREKMFKESDVKNLATLLTLGIMGLGGEECVERAMKLPEELQVILMASVMASRDVIATSKNLASKASMN